MLQPLVVVVVVVVGIKGMNNWCSSWNPLVLGLGCIRLEKEKGSFSSLNGEVAKLDKQKSRENVVALLVVAVVEIPAAAVADLQFRTTA